MSVRIFVKDNTDGKVHEYGTNPHDSLVLQEDGSLHYENLQNCTGTKYPEEGYSFCTVSGKPPEDTDGERIVELQQMQIPQAPPEVQLLPKEPKPEGLLRA